MRQQTKSTSKFRTKNWVEKEDDARGTYNTNIYIKFKTLMLKSCLCEYSYAYILINRNISIAAQAEDNPNNGDKEVVFKSCAPFTDCKNEIKIHKEIMLKTLI